MEDLVPKHVYFSVQNIVKQIQYIFSCFYEKVLFDTMVKRYSQIKRGKMDKKEIIKKKTRQKKTRQSYLTPILTIFWQLFMAAKYFGHL
jgi:hypothetical protein